MSHILSYLITTTTPYGRGTHMLSSAIHRYRNGSSWKLVEMPSCGSASTHIQISVRKLERSQHLTLLSHSTYFSIITTLHLFLTVCFIITLKVFLHLSHQYTGCNQTRCDSFQVLYSLPLAKLLKFSELLMSIRWKLVSAS